MFNPSLYKNKKCLIIGGGKSGISCAKLLSQKLKAEIIISDRQKIKSKFNCVTESNAINKIDEIDFAIKSPGVSNNNPLIKALKARKIKIFSEVEVAIAFSKTENIVMITGTNGKSTTTYLTYKIFDDYLRKSGKKAILCGNIGDPVSKEILKAKKDDWLIIEISSYQIEDSTYLKPKVAAILNITPDHIDHHGSFKKYIKAKFKIFSNMDKNSFLIINGDDKILKTIKKIKPKILKFSIRNQLSDIYIKKQKIFLKKDKKSFTPSNIPGEHNLLNQMAAILIASTFNIPAKSIQKTLDSFKGLEHRIEFVREFRGVKYINDSKGTNVDSTLIALKAIGKAKNIWLIMGGVHKNSPYSPLIPYIKKYVKKILTIGEAAPIIEKELGKYCEIINTCNIKNAVKATRSAQKGDIVLLSPACASFDQFKNFEDRGKKFKALVRRLK